MQKRRKFLKKLIREDKIKQVEEQLGRVVEQKRHIRKKVNKKQVKKTVTENRRLS